MARTQDARLHYPATLRNRGPIRDALREILPETGVVLEIASGSGEHTAYFAPQFRTLDWQPTDGDDTLLASIAAHAGAGGAKNIRPPLRLDVMDPAWPVEAADAILAINMIHVAPWNACLALISGAGRILPAGGPLILYGPFARGGRHTAASNAAFDRSLRHQNRAWGVRDLDDVTAAARPHGLRLDRVIDMPSNNFSVVFRKR